MKFLSEGLSVLDREVHPTTFSFIVYHFITPYLLLENFIVFTLTG